MNTSLYEQPSAPQSENSPVKQRREKDWMKWLLITVALLLLLGLAVYFWWQWQECKKSEEALRSENQQLQSQIDALKKPEPKTTDLPATVCTDRPTDSFKTNIKAALDSKNTAVFASYTSNPVKFVLAASEEGGDKTPDQAAQSMEYTHSATGPWDFSLPAAAIADYDAGFYTDYFDANTYVGKAASGMVVAFDFDCGGKIKQIFIAADDDLL